MRVRSTFLDRMYPQTIYQESFPAAPEGPKGRGASLRKGTFVNREIEENIIDFHYFSESTCHNAMKFIDGIGIVIVYKIKV